MNFFFHTYTLNINYLTSKYNPKITKGKSSHFNKLIGKFRRVKNRFQCSKLQSFTIKEIMNECFGII